MISMTIMWAVMDVIAAATTVAVAVAAMATVVTVGHAMPMTTITTAVEGMATDTSG